VVRGEEIPSECLGAGIRFPLGEMDGDRRGDATGASPELGPEPAAMAAASAGSDDVRDGSRCVRAIMAAPRFLRAALFMASAASSRSFSENPSPVTPVPGPLRIAIGPRTPVSEPGAPVDATSKSATVEWVIPLTDLGLSCPVLSFECRAHRRGGGQASWVKRATGVRPSGLCRSPAAFRAGIRRDQSEDRLGRVTPASWERFGSLHDFHPK